LSSWSPSKPLRSPIGLEIKAEPDPFPRSPSLYFRRSLRPLFRERNPFSTSATFAAQSRFSISMIMNPEFTVSFSLFIRDRPFQTLSPADSQPQTLRHFFISFARRSGVSNSVTSLKKIVQVSIHLSFSFPVYLQFLGVSLNRNLCNPRAVSWLRLRPWGTPSYRSFSPALFGLVSLLKFSHPQFAPF